MQLPPCGPGRTGQIAYAENTGALLYCDAPARAWRPVAMVRGMGPIDPPKASFGAGLGLGVLMGLLIALALVGMGRVRYDDSTRDGRSGTTVDGAS